MTVTADIARLNYTGNGVLVTFPFTWEIYTKNDLKVYVDDVLQVVDVDYTIAVASIEVPAGGNVVFDAGSIPAADTTVSLVLDLPLTQLVDYTEGDKFPAETHERALDRLIKIAQSFGETLKRTPKLPQSSALDLDMPTPTSNSHIGWNAAGDNLANLSDPIITSATLYEVDALTTYGSGATYTDVTINAAIAAIGASDDTTLLLRPGAWVISNDISVSANITLKIPPGSVLNDDASNASITILGNIEAGDHQIFDWGNGTGAILFGDNNKTIVNPYWWFGGTKNSGDEYAAFTSAIASLGNGCNFVIPAGEHYVSDTVEFTGCYRLTLFWYGRLAPYDTFGDYLVYFGISTGDTADPEIADLGMNVNVVGHIRLNCLNDSATTLQQARGMKLYGVYLSHFAPITVLGASGTNLKMANCYENYFEGLWSQGSKNRDAFATPAAWASGSTYANGDKVFRDYAAYAGGTTYSINDAIVYDAGEAPGVQLWRSLADSNVGNTPAAGSAYWQPIKYEYYESVKNANLNKDPLTYTTNAALDANRWWRRVYQDEAVLDMVHDDYYGNIDHQVFGHVDIRHFDNLCAIRMDHSPDYKADGTSPTSPEGLVALIRILSGQIHAMNATFNTAWGSDRSMAYPQEFGNLIELKRARRISFGNYHIRPGYMENSNAIELSGLNSALLCYNISFNDCEITENGVDNVGISVMPYYYGETEPGRFDITFDGMAGTTPVNYRDPSYQVFSAHGQSQHLWYDQTGTIRGELGYTDSAWSLGGVRGAESLRVLPTTSAVNYLVARGAITTEEPSLEVAGADTDIDLRLLPKGTAYVRFGTHTGLAGETVSGYITIKDAGGTLRKIGVVT